MTEPTPLDMAHRRMTETGDESTAHLAFYETLADTPLWVLLDAEPEGAEISPTVVQTAQGAVVLAFDREERMADFTNSVAPQAAMPGRALVRLIAGQDIGLALNVGVAPSETVLSADVVDWLFGVLKQAPQTQEDAQPREFTAPQMLPEPLLAALDARLARAGGLADRAYLVGVRYADGRSGHLLAIIGAPEDAERAIAGAVADAVKFGGEGMPGLDIAFFSPGDPIIGRLEAIALRFDLPAPSPSETPQPSAPGTDPDKPPILR